jgi:hypothetical protein
MQTVIMAGTDRTVLQNVMSTVSTDPVIMYLVTALKGVKLVGKDHIVSKVNQNISSR